MSRSSLSAGDVIEIETERVAYGGDAVGRYEGLAVFVAQAAPGERLQVRVIERKKNYARAVIEKIITTSPSRREPPCRYYGHCGGCQLQHIDYPAQLKAKSDFIRDALYRIGKIDWEDEIPIHAADEFGYRARAQIKLKESSTRGGKRRLRVGFNKPGSHDVCDIESCPVLMPALNQALPAIRQHFKTAANGRNGTPGGPIIPEIEMAADDSGISLSPALPGLPSGNLQKDVGGDQYRFSPTSFFQVNALLLEQLTQVATAGAAGPLALDLYAGVGLFTVKLARKFKHVIGVESDQQASAFALENITLNNLSNVEFHCTRTERWLREFAAKVKKDVSPAPNFILLDPPRAGALEATPEIAALGSRQISYVSCDPTTLARDLRKFIQAGYRLASVIAFDLFPQTYHVETVASLILA